MVWSSDLNGDCDGDFDVEADVASLGSFKDDFAASSEKLGLPEPCPFVSSSSSLLAEDSAPESMVVSVKISQCRIDRGSWRAALLAAISNGSKVHELCVVGCELSVGHVADLCKALGKLRTIERVKLDYVTFSAAPVAEGEEEGTGNGNERGCLVSLFDAACGLSYVSLRGCGLTASFATAAAAALPAAICLSCLDLSSNALGDAGMCTLLNAAALAPRLTHVSVASNNRPPADSSGAGFASCGYMLAAAALLFGRAKTDDDAAALDAGAKAVADYNKGLKDMVHDHVHMTTLPRDPATTHAPTGAAPLEKAPYFRNIPPLTRDSNLRPPQPTSPHTHIAPGQKA